MGILIGILTAIHVLVALFLVMLVLMQKSSDQGVGAAFGGGMTETVFGAGTTTALMRMTVWCACMLLATTLLLAMLYARRSGAESLMQKAIQTGPAMPMSAPNASQPPTLPNAFPEAPASTPAAAASAATVPATPPAPAPAPEKTP